MKPPRLINLKKFMLYTTGWLACKPGTWEIVAHGRTLTSALKKAREKGLKNPLVIKATKHWDSLHT